MNKKEKMREIYIAITSAQREIDYIDKEISALQRELAFNEYDDNLLMQMEELQSDRQFYEANIRSLNHSRRLVIWEY